MKFRKFLSGLLFGAGCALTFIALLAIILPEIDNPQLQLVLASFQMTSEQPLVQMINTFMLFALHQNWRLLYLGLMILGVGGALLLHFTPKHIKERKQPDTPPAPVQTEKAEKPNPYASVCYQEVIPESGPVSVSSSAFHPEPILDRNRIEEDQTPAVSDHQPYFSPRLMAESRAIETDIGLQSQSGSRILIRNTYEAAEVPVPLPENERNNLDCPSTPPSPSFASPSPAPAPSSRIRSTMGRHSAGSSNLPLYL